jgi:hypothetical protein
MSEDPLKALASVLRGLAPSAEPLDRDALLYEAGRASAPPLRWPWVAATAASALLAVSLGVALWAKPIRVVERVVHRQPPEAVVPGDAAAVEMLPAPEQPPAAPYASPWEPEPTPYEQARDNVLRWGLDGLPPAPPARPQTLKTDQLIRPF